MQLKNQTPEEQAQFYLQKWKVAHILLEDGEEPVQMLNHKPYYFITSYGRVFSMWGNRREPLRQFQTATEKYHSGDTKQLAVSLSGCGTYRVSRLMDEYIDLSVFNSNGSSETDRHHIEPYDPRKGTANNRADNIQVLDRYTHRNIVTPIHGAELGEDGLQLKNRDAFDQKLLRLTNVPYVIMNPIKDGKVGATWCVELSMEQANNLLEQVNEIINRMLHESKGEDANEESQEA